jgi:hypothetical protein
MKNQSDLNWIIVGFGLLIISGMTILTLLHEPLSNMWERWNDAPLSVLVERWGVFLQLLAGFSALPELIGDERLQEVDKTLESLGIRIRQVGMTYKTWDDLWIPGLGCFVVISSTLWAVAAISMSFYLLQCSGCTLYARVMFPVILLGPIALALVLGIAILLFKISARNPPETIALAFVVAAVLSLLFPLAMSGFLVILTGFILRLKRSLPLRSIILTVSFPLFVCGTILQLISTFL